MDFVRATTKVCDASCIKIPPGSVTGTPFSSLQIWFIKASEGGLWHWDKRRPEAKPMIDAAGLEKFFGEMAAQHLAIMHEDEYICKSAARAPLICVDVELLITHPDHRKYGHGPALLQRVNELADETD